MKRLFLIAILSLTTTLSASAASPFARAPGNALRHKFSDVLFPPKVGLFNRGIQQVYDTEGRDVSMRYLLDQLILSDVYVYPVGPQRPDLNTEFKIQQRAIQELNKNVKLISRENVRTSQSHTVSGLHANYQLNRDLFFQRNQKCGSQLYVFRDGPWFVAYRFSYPYNKSTVALQHIAAFLAQWKWKPSPNASRV